jgi:hypothetical protein
MTKISVEISVTSGGNLDSILAALRQYGSDVLEIVVINSGKNNTVSDLCKKFNAKEIKEECSLLQSRFLGVINSSGDFILILDETRLPSSGLIHSIMASPHNMVAFPEKNIGLGIISRLDGRDKELIVKNGRSVTDGTPLIIPRFYSMPLIRQAFSKIKEKLNDDKFKNVVAKDDRIIYYEASKICSEKVLISEYSIFHINNTDIFKEFKKYSRYGRTSRVLKGTEYEFMIGLSDKIRKISSFGDWSLFTLYLLRGFAYMVGYYLYRNTNK